MNGKSLVNLATSNLFNFSRLSLIGYAALIGALGLMLQEPGTTANIPVAEPTDLNPTVAAAPIKTPATPARALSPEERAWETILEQNLGKFYLPGYKTAKAAGQETAWDYVKDDPKLPRALLIGDSISRGYTLPTRYALAGKVNLHRAPENCGKTLNGLKKLDLWLGTGQWDVIHFNFGIHDWKLAPADYENQLTIMTERLKQTGTRLIWASTTPLPDKYNDETGGDQKIARLNEIAAGIMQKHGIPIDDLYGLVKPRQQELQNTNDCHFPEEKYAVLGNQVAQSILKALKTPAATRGTETALTQETLLWEDNFERSELGPGWHPVRGKAGIKDGRLLVEGPAEIIFDPQTVQRSFGRDLRVEYDACAEQPGDLSLMLNVANSGVARSAISPMVSGYFFGFASQMNTVNKLLAFNEEIVHGAKGLAQPGKWHHVTAEKRGATLCLLVDGQEAVSATQPRLWGGGGLGFYVWTTGMVDNVKVYGLPPKAE